MTWQRDVNIGAIPNIHTRQEGSISLECFVFRFVHHVRLIALSGEKKIPWVGLNSIWAFVLTWVVKTVRAYPSLKSRVGESRSNRSCLSTTILRNVDGGGY